jgi:hypothetical protein
MLRLLLYCINTMSALEIEGRALVFIESSEMLARLLMMR